MTQLRERLGAGMKKHWRIMLRTGVEGADAEFGRYYTRWGAMRPWRFLQTQLLLVPGWRYTLERIEDR